MDSNFNPKLEVAPVVILGVFFSSIVFTQIKVVLLGLAIVVFAGRRLKKIFDLNFVLLVLFLLFYFVASLYGGQEKTQPDPQLLTSAPVLYLGGRWLALSSTDGKRIARVLWIFGLLLASTTLSAVLADVNQYGFFGRGRNLQISTDGLEISATVLGGFLVSLVGYGGLIFLPAQSLKVVERVVVLFFFLVAIAAAIRLGSRTILVIGAASLFVGLLVNMRRRRVGFFVFVTALFFLLTYVFWGGYFSDVDIFSYYQDRLNKEDYGIGSAGGRTERWINSLSLMFENPFGWRFSLNGYSHNLWLDVARNGGIPSLVMLIIISALAFTSFSRSLARNSKDACYLTTFSCLLFSYALIFLVEPIFDGFIYVFSSFCCIWGVADAYRPRRLSLRRSLGLIDDRDPAVSGIANCKFSSDRTKRGM